MKAWDHFKQTFGVSKQVFFLVWKASRSYTVLSMFLLITNAIIPIIQAYFIKEIIDNLTLSLTQDVAFSHILFFVIGFIVVVLLNRGLWSLQNSTQVILGNLFSKSIHEMVVEKTTKLAFWRFEDPKFHDLLGRTRQQSTWRPMNTFYHLFGTIKNILTLISVFGVLYIFSPGLIVLMILFSLPALIIEIKYGNEWWNLLFKETQDSRKLNYYQYLMAGHNEMKDIKVLNLRSFLLARHRKLYNKIFKEQKSLIITKQWKVFLSYLLADVVLVAFYLLLSWRTYTRTISIGDFTFYSTMYSNGVGALQDLVRDVSGIYENNLFTTELLEFLNLEEEKESSGRRAAPKDVQDITFKNVWFRYPGMDNWILKNVSFTINNKQKIALVGENGAGKTTIVKLLLRLYTPTKGSILLNGIPIEEYDLIKYRDFFGVTFQDFAAFFFTVEENIGVGDIKRKIPKKELVHIAKKAHIHDKIMTMPKKYKTVLGRWYNKGNQISRGQWQRVAIARALIRKCPMYILDEPTASLDAKAEYLVFQEFKSHVRGKTAMFISHRFSNVKLADTILVMDKGKIIQTGSHKQLMKKAGMYKKLYNFQAKRYAD